MNNEKPMFKASVLLYPTHVRKPLSKDKLNEVELGGLEKAKQILEILKSAPLREKVNQEFNLFSRYGINQNQDSSIFYFIKEFKTNFLFEVNEEGLIHIEVLDRSQDTAVLIVDCILNILDKELIEKSINREEYTKNQVILRKEIQQLKDSILVLNRMGVENQETRLALTDIIKNAKSKNEKDYLLEKVEINNRHGLKYDSLLVLHDQKTTQLMNQDALFSIEQIQPRHFVILKRTPLTR